MSSKRKKRRDWSKELFAKPGAKDNFFTLTGRAASIFGGKRRSARRSQRASLNISGAGNPDRDAPQIGGSGPASYDLPDLGARQRDRSKARIPDIGAGDRSRSTQGVPDIGGSGPTTRGAPSLGGPLKRGRRKDRVPSIGAMSGSRDAPSIGGGADGVPDISGAAGAPEGGGRSTRRGFSGRAMRSFSAYAGFKPMSAANQQEFELFCRRAAQAGYDVDDSQRMSWRANIMLGKYRAEDLWNSDTGSEIERRYGKRGQDLDLPEEDRPARGFIKEKEEVKEQGVKPSTKNFFRRIIDRVRGQP